MTCGRSARRAASRRSSTGTARPGRRSRWTGQGWALVPGPVANGNLHAALAPGGAVWIAGGQDTPATLFARWAGTGWQVTPSPSPGRAGNWLLGLAARTPDDLWAVGAY